MRGWTVFFLVLLSILISGCASFPFYPYQKPMETSVSTAPDRLAYQLAVEGDSYAAFSEFIETFPDSPYVVGAEIELHILAQQETGGAVVNQPEKVRLYQLLGLPGEEEGVPIGESDDAGLGLGGEGEGGGGTGEMIGLGAFGPIGNGLGSGTGRGTGRGYGSSSSERDDEPDPVVFDTGRIAHHAPSSMVVDRPYFLEVIIQPLTAADTVESVDALLKTAIGSGLAPGSDAPRVQSNIDSVKTSELMTVSLKGSGFDIQAITETLQPLDPGELTIWKWEVIPRETGTAKTLIFDITNARELGGRIVRKSVKNIPLSISVTSVEDLLDLRPNQASDWSSAAISRSGLDVAPGLLTTTLSPKSNHAATQPTSACDTKIGNDSNRIALLFTNLEYGAPLSRLTQTHIDGDLMSTALEDVGFTVTHCKDLNRAMTIKELSKHGLRLQGRMDAGETPVSFFYYSGHGLNFNGTNYILPTDLSGASEIDVRDGAVAFEDIFNRLPVGPLSFVVFDACRTVMADDSKGLMRTYEPVTWVSGLFQAFATEPGKTAADDGLYSKTLSRLMRSLDEPANVLFKRVQDQIGAATDYRQNPNYIDRTIGGEFYFSRG
ncbi:MAG: caspase family protein [Henriciella sp.]